MGRWMYRLPTRQAFGVPAFRFGGPGSLSLHEGSECLRDEVLVAREDPSVARVEIKAAAGNGLAVGRRLAGLYGVPLASAWPRAHTALRAAHP